MASATTQVDPRSDYWHGINVSWWLVNCRPPCALPVEVAAAWLDSGEYPVLLGTHEEALAVVAPVTEPFAETLFEVAA